MEFIDRLIIEREELQDKYFKLKNYLFSNMKNNDNDTNYDFDLLQKQYEIMGDYLIILNIRIRKAIEKYGMNTNLTLIEDWDSLWMDLIDKCILNKISYISTTNFKIYQIINRNSLYEINDTDVVPFYVKHHINTSLKLIKNKNTKNTKNTTEEIKLKAKIDNVEIPWSVATLEVLIKDDNFKNKYLHHEETEDELIRTFTDGFNYIKGQIVELSLTGFGRVPAVVININDRDVNGHLTYDIVLFIGERNKSAIKSKERYLWRFTEKADENTISNFNKLIEIIFNPKYGYDELFSKDYEIDTLCYLNENSIVSYNLNQINPNTENVVLKEADDNEH